MWLVFLLPPFWNLLVYLITDELFSFSRPSKIQDTMPKISEINIAINILPDAFNKNCK